MIRKGLSTSIIRANISKIDQLPDFDHYELTFFKFEDIEKILDFLTKKRASFGVHAPFVYRYAQIHPQPTSLDPYLRRDTFEKNLECVNLAKRINADYVVIHFPNAEQKENWLSIYDQVVSEFSSFSQENFQVRIENVYGNNYFHSANDFKDFLEKTKLKMCLDIGHLLIDSEIYGFDHIKFVEELEPYIAEFHIYYADKINYVKCHHKAWEEERKFLQLLELIREMKADFVLEPSPECLEDFEKLLEYIGSL